jgi:hypothetical protein
MPTNSLSNLLQWVQQAVLMIQRQDGHLEMMNPTDAATINYAFQKANVTCTKGFVTRRLSSGGAQSALEGGMDPDTLRKNMGHISAAHDKKYLNQLMNSMQDMAAVAGHSSTLPCPCLCVLCACMSHDDHINKNHLTGTRVKHPRMFHARFAADGCSVMHIFMVVVR